jgi:putative hemolysin
LQWTGKRYFFGCCSLTSQDPGEGRRLHGWLAREGHLHPTVRVGALPLLGCGTPTPEELASDDMPVKVPKLFGTYLRYGVKACGEPAIDRAFKTIDWFVLLDLESIAPRVRQLFFAGLPRRGDTIGA